MSKQIKIGLDKNPAPITKQFNQLIDTEGTPLVDAAGNPLLTEEDASLGAFTTSDNALSIFTNNKGKDEAVKVIEQFPEVSAVSNSLLGIPRAEEQQSLFSDVATYGLDEDNWSQYTFTQTTSEPIEWFTKKNPIYGRRENPTFNEGSYEQALYLKNFSSQYTWPGSTIAERRAAPTETMRQYMNFVLMGKYLYELFSVHTETQSFANSYLLDDSVYFLKADSTRDKQYDDAGYIEAFDVQTSSFSGAEDLFDVGYTDYDGDGIGSVTIQEAFDKVEAWTYIFGKIVDGSVEFPLFPSNNTLGINGKFEDSAIFASLKIFAGKCRPGGRSDLLRIAVLESTDTFRYQPGRVSGFTFGSRMQNDATSIENILEWGCSNDTDEYMFQLRGSEFNIIRRSVLPLGATVLARQGLQVSDENLVNQKGIGTATQLYETVIPRNKFNGDALLGSDKSGHVLTFEDVTMYKIEFSWYGAIGAKFYAYVPIGPGECRWVLIHRLVIENGMGKPVLKNPDFKFKYFVYSGDSAGLVKPVFLYKYGSSYYIDGGDEGTLNLTTIASQTKDFFSSYAISAESGGGTNASGTPVIGIKPKNAIFSTDSTYSGNGVSNYKKIYPSTLSATTTEDARIDIVEIPGGPDGAHYCFQPGIEAGLLTPSARQTVELKFSGDGKTLTSRSGTFTSADIGAKVIADGLYNVYVGGDINGKFESEVFRRDNRDGTTYQLISGRDDALGSVKSLMKSNGTVVKISDTNEYEFEARLANYYGLVGSAVPINSSKFKIHFLNPNATDVVSSKRHFADFGVGVIPYKPVKSGATSNELKFETGTGTYEYFDAVKNEVPMAEYTCREVRVDAISKAEFTESDRGYGNALSVDPRVPSPKGGDTGYVSAVVGEVKFTDHWIISSKLVEPGDADFQTYGGQYRLVFNSDAVTYPGKVSFPTGINVPTDLNATDSYTSEIGYNNQSLSTDNDFKVYYTSNTFVDTNGALLNGAGQLDLTTATGAVYAYFASKNQGSNSPLSVGLYNFGDDGADGSVPFAIQTKDLTLSDDFKVSAYNTDGEEMFQYRKFTKTRAIKFSSGAMYLFFALKDYAKVYNISVEEIYPEYTTTHTPQLSGLRSDNTNITMSFPSGSDETKSPGSFNDVTTLSPSLFDLTTLNPLRPGTTIFSIYTGANTPTKIDLSTVFGTDRKKISKGLYNNIATYFTAKSISGNPGKIEMALTVKEQ